MIKISSISSREILKNEISILAEHYVSEGSENLRKLSKIKTTKLKDVADVIQIIIFGKRGMQSPPEKGIPLYPGSEILKINPEPSTYLHKKFVKNFKKGSICRKKWILMTLSGTVGSVGYVDYRFENAFVTDDAMRIIAKTIPWGCLYAILKSNFYKKIIEKMKYGTVVKHIHYSQIEEIPIPMFSESLMKEVHQLIEESARLRTEAINRKKLAISKFQNYVGFKRIIPKDLYTWKNRSLIFRNKYTRLDSRYHSPDVYNILMHLKHKNIKCELLKSLTDKNDKGIFIPGRFKRNFVDSKNGLSYVTGADISKINPLENCKYLSIEYTKNQDKLLLKKGYILITCSGVIGNSYLVDQYLDSTIGTPDLIRIIPDSKKVKAGYLFAYFNTEIGKILIKRNTYGSVVPHIEAHHLFELPVPILDNKEIEYIHKKIIKSIEYNEIALSLEKKAISMVEEELN